jgi:hypothetical protein
MEVVNHAVESFRIKLQAVQAVEGESTNGHRQILGDLRKQRRTVQEFQDARAAEENCISEFLFRGRVFWEITIRSGTALDEMIAAADEPHQILCLLPPTTSTKTKILACEWNRESKTASQF